MPNLVSPVHPGRLRPLRLPGGGGIVQQYIGSMGAGGSGAPVQEQYFYLPHDTVLNPTYASGVYSTQSGNWGTASTWSVNRVPISGDLVSISPGHTVVYDISGAGYIKAVGIVSGGTLKWKTDGNTSLVAVTIFNQEGGQLIVGNSGSPILSGFTAEIVFPDVPLDTVNDPFQYWNGVVSLGAARMYGQPKTSTAWRTSVEPLSGVVSLTFSGAPTNWHIGDQIVLPDSRQVSTAATEPGAAGYISRTEVRTIVSGHNTAQVFLNSGLSYLHDAARDVSGTITFFPHAGNLSRNVRVFSANPSGVRGHMLFTNLGNYHLYNVEVRDMGRTLVYPLNNTTGTYGNITHVGTNQIGRYALHSHHVTRWNYDPVTDVNGCAVWDTVDAQAKWGVTIHGTTWSKCQNNVVYNKAGWGIGTENGAEIGLTINNNFVVGTGPVSGTTGMGAPDSRGWIDIGFEGWGIWTRGMMLHTMRNNVVADCRGGWGTFLSQMPASGNWAAGPLSGDGLISLSPYAAGISGWSNNEFYGGQMVHGITIWDHGAIGKVLVSNTVPHVMDDLKMWHVRNRLYDNYRTSKLYWNSPIVRGNYALEANGQATNTAFFLADYMAVDFLITSGDIQGCITGVYAATNTSLMVVNHSILANYNNLTITNRWGANIGFLRDVRTIRYDMNLNIPLLSGDNSLGSGKAAVAFGDDLVGFNDANLIGLDTCHISGHNRVSGANYRAYFRVAGRDIVLPQTNPSGDPTSQPAYWQGSPVSGLTNIQNWSGNVNALASGICCGGALPPTSLVVVSGIDGLVEAL